MVEKIEMDTNLISNLNEFDTPINNLTAIMADVEMDTNIDTTLDTNIDTNIDSRIDNSNSRVKMYDEIRFTYSHFKKDFVDEILKRRGFISIKRMSYEEKIVCLIHSHIIERP